VRYTGLTVRMIYLHVSASGSAISDTHPIVIPLLARVGTLDGCAGDVSGSLVVHKELGDVSGFGVVIPKTHWT